MRIKERLEDLFFVSVAGIFFVAGVITWLSLSHKRALLHQETKALKHHITLLCNYIDNLPKKYRAVYDVCLEQENQENKDR